MKKVFTFFSVIASFLSYGQSVQNSTAAAFTSGNVVVVRVGDGAAALPTSGTAVPTFLDEYNAAGTLVQSIALPVTASGSNKRFTLAGTSTTEGVINRSVNGQYLVLGGYDAAPGTVGVNTGTTGTSATVNRVVAIVDAGGNINTSTALGDAFNSAAIRAVATDNGTNLWLVGGNEGVRYTTTGSTTSTVVSSTATNLRTVAIWGGDLYISSGASTYRMAKVGTGLPTTTGNAAVNLTGMPTTTASLNQFFFVDTNGDLIYDVLYVADDASSGGGIAKYSLVSGTWTLNNAVGTAADGYRGLTGVYNSSTGAVTLYVVRKGGSTTTGGGELVSLVDNTGFNANITATPTLLATATANTAFRGVSLAPAAITPVTLSSFTGTYNNGKALLKWTVSNETNVRGYEVEKSLNGTEFVNIGFVEATNTHTYGFAADQKTTLAYYRLKMTDKDGSFKYSNIISLNGKEGIKVDVYPNPAKGVLILSHPKAYEKATVSVTTINGKRVLTQAIAGGALQTTLDVSKLTAGTYVVVYETGSTTTTTTFVKQ
jgi:hypothetical protein